MARYLHKYQQKSTFKTWLFTIGRNVIIDYHRKHKRQKSVKGFYEGEMEALATTNKESEWQNDNMEAILDILAKLPQDYRSVIQLRFVINQKQLVLIFVGEYILTMVSQLKKKTFF